MKASMHPFERLRRTQPQLSLLGKPMLGLPQHAVRGTHGRSCSSKE